MALTDGSLGEYRRTNIESVISAVLWPVIPTRQRKARRRDAVPIDVVAAYQPAMRRAGWTGIGSERRPYTVW
jgi:hypothetical protein